MVERLVMATMTSKGQVTIPASIRKDLGLGAGWQMVFMKENGKWYLGNATRATFRLAEEEFSGEARKAGSKDEDAMHEYMKNLREEMGC